MRLIVIRSNYNDTVSKFLNKYVVVLDFGTESTSKRQKIIGKKYKQSKSKDILHGTFHFREIRRTAFEKESFFHRVSVYEPGTIDVNKMLTSLSTIIE